MSTDVEKAMEEYEAACAELSQELSVLSIKLTALLRLQNSLMTSNSLLTSWLRNAEELWKHGTGTRPSADA